MMVESGIGIKCANCSEVFYETTEHFDESVPVTGRMIRMKEPFASYGWEHTTLDDSAIGGQLECPECGSMMVDYDGKAKLDIREDTHVGDSWFCGICNDGRPFKMEHHLKRHKEMAHGGTD